MLVFTDIGKHVGPGPGLNQGSTSVVEPQRWWFSQTLRKREPTPASVALRFFLNSSSFVVLLLLLPLFALTKVT
jgi:hypothetical protein